MFGREIGSLEKSHGIGQTPCSYERYLVIKTVVGVGLGLNTLVRTLRDL